MVMDEITARDLHVWWRKGRSSTVEMDEKVEMNAVEMNEKMEMNAVEMDKKVEINAVEIDSKGGDRR